MWAICVEYYGKFGATVPAGNDGMQKLHNKTKRGWISETTAMRKRTTGWVYVVTDVTQKMCEMSRSQLAHYVEGNHVAMLPR